MRSALEIVRERFKAEGNSYKGKPQSVLIIISDGDSTDGSPEEACRNIMEDGTTVVSGYLTSADITEPRKLYSQPESGWPSGARSLFNCSSQIGEEAGVLNIIQPTGVGALGEFASKGWQVSPGSRLFLQLNQSELLSQFLTTVLALHTSADV